MLNEIKNFKCLNLSNKNTNKVTKNNNNNILSLSKVMKAAYVFLKLKSQFS